MKVARITVLIIAFLFIGYLRTYYIINILDNQDDVFINRIQYEMRPFESGAGGIFSIKGISTLIYTLIYVLMSTLMIGAVFRNKAYTKITALAMTGLVFINIVLFVAYSLFDLSPHTGAPQYLKNAIQSPFFVLFFIAVFKFNQTQPK